MTYRERRLHLRVMSPIRKSYPSDVTDSEWEFLIPYLTLMREDAPQRDYSLRDQFDALRRCEDRVTAPDIFQAEPCSFPSFVDGTRVATCFEWIDEEGSSVRVVRQDALSNPFRRGKLMASKTKMVTAVFRDRANAQAAYDMLRNQGYLDNEINVLMSDKTRATFYANKEEHEKHDAGTLATEVMGVGGAIGTAYVIAGFVMTRLMSKDGLVGPIRTGVGARLGINVG